MTVQEIKAFIKGIIKIGIFIMVTPLIFLEMLIGIIGWIGGGNTSADPLNTLTYNLLLNW